MRYLLNIMIIILLGACSSLKVQTDYNPEYDFSQLAAFAIVHRDKAGDDTLQNDRILRALRADLTQGPLGNRLV